MNSGIKNKSITYKLTVFVISIIIFQAILFTSSLKFGGVIEKGRENAYKSFSDTVYNRNNYLQSEMKNSWTNLSPYLQELSAIVQDCDSNEDFYNQSTNTLINMLRATHSSGAFILLPCEDFSEENRLNSLYIRDYDPFLNDSSNKDLYLFSGPASIARDLQIPLDQNWKYSINLTQDNEKFFKNPWDNITETYNPNYLGYWSKPFYVVPGDFQVITYTLPFFDKNGTPRGVLGVEISLNYLQQFLPASEIQRKDSLGYMIGFKDKGDENITPLIMGGALQKRMISGNENFILEPVDDDLSLYKVLNHQGKEDIFASIQKIGLYLNNTPFEDEEWYLIGLMGERNLLSYVNNIQNVMSLSLILSVLIGIIGSSFVSFKVTRPIIDLSEKVKKSDKKSVFIPDGTGLLEVDELAQAMAVANNELLASSMKISKIIELVDVSMGAFEYSKSGDNLFITEQLKKVLKSEDTDIEDFEENKDRFIDYLEWIFKNVENGEEDVYFIPGKKTKWVKIKTVETEGSVLGVAINVTQEIMEKRKLKREIDFDNLTGLYSRSTGERLFEEVVNSNEDIQTAAVIMFDLDFLKEVNDNHGHNFGDAYIRESARRFKTVKPAGKSILSRRSGDEFLLFLYQYPDKDAVRKEMDDFFAKLKEIPMPLPNGDAIYISMSAGLVWFEDTRDSYEELINKADRLMYKAKKTRKGTLME